MIINYIASRNLCQLVGNKSDFELIRNKFSVQNEAAKYSKLKYVNNRIYAITPTGLFRPNLLTKIKEYADRVGIPLNIDDKIYNIIYPVKTNILQNLLFDYYDYQKDCLNQLLNKGKGLCIVGTGGGKTIITAGLIESYFKNKGPSFKCLMIVDSVSMVKQTIERFKQYGVSFTVGDWSSKDVALKYNCTVINTQLITKVVKDRKTKKIITNNPKRLIELFNDADLLIFDEVHHVQQGNNITKFVDHLAISNKYGFTGTLPQSQIDQWLLQGIFGDVLYEKPSKELRQEGRLTETEIKIFNINYINPPKFKFTIESDGDGNEYIKDPTEVLDKEYMWVYDNNWRNNFIKKICNGFNKNILLLVNSLHHLDQLYNTLSNILNKEIRIVKGDVQNEERQRIFKEFEGKNNIICIAMSTVFSTGIDISNICMVLFAAGGKSFIRIVQSIGRGIRLHENKDKLLVVDIADNLKYGIEHLNARIDTYKKESFPYHIYNIKESL